MEKPRAEKIAKSPFVRKAVGSVLGFMALTGGALVFNSLDNTYMVNHDVVIENAHEQAQDTKELGIGLGELCLPLAVGVVVGGKRAGKSFLRWINRPPSIQGEQPLYDRSPLSEVEQDIFTLQVSEFYAKPLTDEERQAFEDIKLHFNAE